MLIEREINKKKRSAPCITHYRNATDTPRWSVTSCPSWLPSPLDSVSFGHSNDPHESSCHLFMEYTMWGRISGPTVKGLGKTCLLLSETLKNLQLSKPWTWMCETFLIGANFSRFPCPTACYTSVWPSQASMVNPSDTRSSTFTRSDSDLRCCS